MPASSVSSLNSWGVYIFASAALVLLFVPQLSQAALASRASADWRNLDGASWAIDSLRPGVVLSFSYGVSNVSDPLRLRGHQVSCSDGNQGMSAAVRWALPNYTLIPSVSYRLSLSQGRLVVTRAV